MIGDPATAAPRTDLPFLRRRSRPAAPAARPPTAAPAAARGPDASKPIDYTRHSSARRSGADAQPAQRPKIDFSRPDRRTAAAPSAAPPSAAPPSAAPPSAAPPPAPPRPAQPASAPVPSGSSSLDLSGPSDAPAPSAPAPPASGVIDFTRPERPAAPSASSGSSSGSLDLSDPAPAAARRPTRPALRVQQDARIGGTGQHLLNVQHPTLTLTRMQSGVGHLTIEAVCSPEIGDLRLGALYQLRSGGTSTVQHAGGNRFAPSSRRPVIVGSREEYERIGIDLRQVRDIERITVYAFSESRTPLTWGGTLVLDTFGGARIETPLETLYRGSLAVLLSLYNLDGELVVRAELESIAGDVREAARAYGYDRITWRDDRTPVD